MNDPTETDIEPTEPTVTDDVNSLGVKRVENNTHRHIHLLPATYVDPQDSDVRVDFPSGVRLLPGLNTVPNKYFLALEAKEAENAPVKGAKKGAPPGKRYPGRELIKQLTEPVTIQTVNGTHISPQITIYEPDAVSIRERSDGPRLPATLAEYTLRGALELIKHVKDVKALKLWSKDKREAVSAAAAARLNDIGR